MIDGRSDVVRDNVAVKGNPVADITEVTRVSFVMKGGTVYKRQ